MITDFFSLTLPGYIFEMKKTVFLILTLAIPVSIFLFLKFFGINTFEVPILFEEGISDCPNSTGLHTIPEFEYIGETEKNHSSKELKGFIIFGILNGESLEENREKIVELVRIQDAFYEIGPPSFLLFIKGEKSLMPDLIALSTEMGLEHSCSNIVFMPEGQLMDYLQCGIALIDANSKDFDNLVLVDLKRQIRGIYQSRDIEQTDRLILELKILKQKM